MAAGETYPKISRKIWWLLRDKLKKSVPSAITTTFVTAMSSMKDASAKSNVLVPLRDLGLIDENGKPTELAERWRHDDDYEQVCHEIRSNVYPKELIEAFSEADSTQKDAIKTWFMKAGQVGEIAAKMYTETYILLTEADFTKSDDKTSNNPAPRTSGATQKTKPTRQAQKSIATPVAATSTEQSTSIVESPHHPRRLPAIHIDVQVHISPDTSPDQIDRIFESMAKHLGGFVK
ncbi:MAG: DUF5343 domain-containing protein [Proteobacteria bacterium]|nr:DUF5343 domain-containing protein [Pseudomonadota bacterium]